MLGAIGKLTDQDYKDVLIPRLESIVHEQVARRHLPGRAQGYGSDYGGSVRGYLRQPYQSGAPLPAKRPDFGEKATWVGRSALPFGQNDYL